MSIIEKAVARLEKSAKPDEERDFAAASSVHVKTPPQSTVASGTRCAFDFDALHSQGYFVSEDSNALLAEQYRKIKRPILRNAFQNVGHDKRDLNNVLVITSAQPGEGKTFTSLNLALALAQEKDINVLLVDGDLIRTQMSNLLGLNGEPGLTDLLNDNYQQMLKVVIDTNIEGLHVLPAGRIERHSTELLSSKRMELVLGELMRVYNDSIIIFDAPPMLSSSQSNVLCELAGQILVVVEEGKTTKNAIAEAIRGIDKSKTIGMILNKATSGDSDTYYSSYGYQS